MPLARAREAVAITLTFLVVAHEPSTSPSSAGSWSKRRCARPTPTARQVPAQANCVAERLVAT
jgi:hypothetical protein